MVQIYLVFYICVIRLTGLSEALTLNGYEFLEGFGWLQPHTIKMNWADARLRCNIENGNLASPTTSNISDQLQTAISENYNDDEWVFIDVHASKPKGNFVSGNGMLSKHIPLRWAKLEPNNFEDKEDCLAMNGLGEVADVNCLVPHYFICIKTNVTSFSECDTKDTGYNLEPHIGSCYKFHGELVSWREAFMVCIAEHAHLAVINSDNEAKVIMELFAKNIFETRAGMKNSTSYYYAHIGFLDYEKKGEFFTIFGMSLKKSGFREWMPNHPNNDPDSDQHCGSIAREGKLSDISCTAKYAFICETPVKYF